MITRKTSDHRWIASVFDPAVRRAIGTPSKLTEFCRTRDLKKIGIDENGNCSSTGEVATLFKVRPITVELSNLTDDRTALNCSIIFASCVVDIKNAGFDVRREDGKLSPEIIDAIGLDIIKDVAGYCCDLNAGRDGDATPFSLPDGFAELTGFLRLESAKRAAEESVKKVSTDTEPETTQATAGTGSA